MPVQDTVQSTTTSWNDPNASKISRLMKKYQNESESDSENEVVDPFR